MIDHSDRDEAEGAPLHHDGCGGRLNLFFVVYHNSVTGSTNSHARLPMAGMASRSL